MADWQKQYRTVPTDQTAALDSLSVATLRHFEQSINSTIVAMSPKIVSDASPSLTSADSSTAETLMRVYGPFQIAGPYDALSVSIGHYRSTGTASTTWTLYCGPNPYFGTRTPFDITQLGAQHSSATIATTSSGTHAISTSVRQITITRGSDEHIWLALTATNGDTSTRARMTTLDVTAQRRGAYA